MAIQAPKLKGIFTEKNALGAEITRIAGYPRVTPETFEQSYVLSDIEVDPQNPDSFKENEAVTYNIEENSVIVEQVGEAPLPGNPNPDAPMVPIYDISYRLEGSGLYILKNRFAFIGYGSNSSPKVLAAKFGPQHKYKDPNGNKTDEQKIKDPTCPVIMANVADHEIVYSAFLGGAGSVPVTMIKKKGSTARLSVSFYDEDQVKRVNASEANYDVVALNTPDITMNSGDTLPVGPCVYESMWGAWVNDMERTMCSDLIPHKGFKSVVTNTMELMKTFVSLLKDKKLVTSDMPFEQVIMALKSPTDQMYPDLSEAELAQLKEERSQLRVYLNAHLPASHEGKLDATLIQEPTLRGLREKALQKVAVRSVLGRNINPHRKNRL